MAQDPMLAPVKGAERREVAGVVMDIARVGAGRVKRVVYQPGFRWSSDMKPIVRTRACMHAHVGFLVQGHIEIRYEDGCTVEFVAPQAVEIAPGHDGSVVIILQEVCTGSQGSGEKIAQAYEFLESTTRIDIYGTPSPSLVDTLMQMGMGAPVRFHSTLAGMSAKLRAQTSTWSWALVMQNTPGVIASATTLPSPGVPAGQSKRAGICGSCSRATPEVRTARSMRMGWAG